MLRGIFYHSYSLSAVILKRKAFIQIPWPWLYIVWRARGFGLGRGREGGPMKFKLPLHPDVKTFMLHYFQLWLETSFDVPGGLEVSRVLTRVLLGREVTSRREYVE